MPRLSKIVQTAQQAMSIKYNNRMYEMKQAGRKVVVLSLGEAFFDIPLKDFSDLPMPDSYHYSHSRGIPQLRKRIADYYFREYGVPVDADREILITSGSKAVIHFVMMSVIDPGDEVLMHEPLWVSYPEQARLCYGVPVQIPYQAGIEDYAKFLTPRTKVLVVNNPCNPRGSVLGHEQMEQLMQITRDNDLLLLADEGYSEFVKDSKFRSFGALDARKKHVAVCNSISKNFGMSGWRIGYVIAHPELVDQVLKVNQHLVTCPATILEHYVERHFEDILHVTRPQIRNVVEKRQAVARYVGEIGLKSLEGNATFYLFLSVAPSALGSEAFCDRLLDEHGVCVVPGIGYGASCDSFVRISVGTEPMDQIRWALDRIKDLISETA
jgi:aspartate aminotransferase/aminotransferase